MRPRNPLKALSDLGNGQSSIAYTLSGLVETPSTEMIWLKYSILGWAKTHFLALETIVAFEGFGRLFAGGRDAQLLRGYIPGSHQRILGQSGGDDFGKCHS